MSVALPKQWRDWCAGMRLKPHGKRGHGQHQWFYLKGRGHYWRVNCHGMLQCGDTYADFDRWARCRIKSCPIPTTKAGFDAAVVDLLDQWYAVTPNTVWDACERAGVEFVSIDTTSVEHQGTELAVVSRSLETIVEFELWLDTMRPKVVYFKSIDSYAAVDDTMKPRSFYKIRLAWGN